MRKNKHERKGLIRKIMERLLRRDLLKNKVYALLLMGIGYITIHLLEGDGTVFILTLLIGIPVFFAKRNVIID